MRIDYTLEGSSTVLTTEVFDGRKAYAFITFMIDEMNQCNFHTANGVITLEQLYEKIGCRFISSYGKCHEPAFEIGKALGLPTESTDDSSSC